MTKETIIEAAVSDTASVQVSATAKPEVYQFGGLPWALEYNAYQARLGTGIESQTVNAMNALLTAYAALEALVIETASAVVPSLYADKQFRRHGLIHKFRKLLDETGRADEPVPDVVEEISDNRIALTHSEPDNERSAKLGRVISASDALRFARFVRKIAEWLWQGKRPGAVAAAYDQVNGFLGPENEATFKAL